MNATIATDHLDQYLEASQREIAFCQNCQPLENGKRVWRLGIPMKMAELLRKLEIPEAEHEYLAESLECNNCGAMLDLDAMVGLKSQNERELERLWRKWEAQYANRFRDLHDFLAEYPSLAIQHRLGRQILKGLGELPRTEIAFAAYYQVRKVINGSTLTNEDFNAEVVQPHAGPYHHPGQQAFVLTDSEEAAAHEILEGKENLAWLQKFRVTRCKGVLDLSQLLEDKPSPFVEALTLGLRYRGAPQPMAAYTHEDHNAHLVSRFLTDCARLHGFTGVRCKSTKHFGNNLILFSWPVDLLVPQGEPYLYVRQMNSA